MRPEPLPSLSCAGCVAGGINSVCGSLMNITGSNITGNVANDGGGVAVSGGYAPCPIPSVPQHISRTRIEFNTITDPQPYGGALALLCQARSEQRPSRRHRHRP